MDKYFHTQCIIYVFYIDSNSGPNSDSEFAKSIVQQETAGNLDPLAAQKRAIAVCKLDQLKNESANLQVNMRYLIANVVCV